jgi:serine/threonine protein kinase
MHEIGFIYRTLNPNNILIDVNGNIRVVDFGKRKINTNDSYYKENMIECAYIAPELLSGKEYDKTADYWSLGILIYEMLNGAIPFYNMDK